MLLILTNPTKIDRKSASEIIVTYDKGTKDYNLRDVSGIVVLGSKAYISTALISLLSSNNIPLVISTKKGVSVLSANGITLLSEVREKQFRMSEQEKEEVAREFITAKFKGLSNLLKYYKVDPPDLVEGNDLLTWEANNSRRFWERVFTLFPPEVAKVGRKPTSPDPFNKALSLAYSLLYAVCNRALLSFGFDPTYGVMHKTRFSTPLTFDFSEMFKPVAVHAVIRAYKKGLKVVDGELDKDSVRKVSEEFFSTMTKKQRDESIYKAVFTRARKLAMYLRKGDKKIRYTFIYDPRSLVS